MHPLIEQMFQHGNTITARALLVGDRIDLKALETAQLLAVTPLTIAAGRQGCAVLFRYGAVVLFGVDPLQEASFLEHLAPFVHEPSQKPEVEEATITLNPENKDGIYNNVIQVPDCTFPRLQIIADSLAKSVVLAQYEARVAAVFDRIEPLAADLQQHGGRERPSRELLHHIGSTLMIQLKTVGRVEIEEKPELLWEHPELERLHLRLIDEYELRERQLALERKLDLISRTAETLLELLQHKRSLRVEWYIVILIMVEIVLTLYEMFIRHHL